MPAFSALYSVLRKIRAAISFLLAAPLMVVALSAASMNLTSNDACAQERQERQDADEILTAAGRFHARLRVLEKKASLFKPDGTPVRAKVRTSSKDAGKPMPRAKEHILLARQVSAHKAAIKKLQARVKAFEKEARGHELGHQLGDSGGMAAKKKASRRAKEAGGQGLGDGKRGARTFPALDAKSKELDRAISALETESRTIGSGQPRKIPGRLK